MIFEKIRKRLEEQLIQSAKDMQISEIYEDVQAYGGKYLAYNNAISIINEVQTEYNNGWISVDDRLPELHEEVLVTQFFDDSEHYNVTNASLISMLDGSGRVRWCSYDHFIDYVIAWQPLPQPPKGE